MKPIDLVNAFYGRAQTLASLCNEEAISIEGVNSLRALLSRQTFDVAIVGEFTAGKSTIINALLGADVLPTELEPSTARVTFLQYADTPSADLQLKDGSIVHREFSNNFPKTLTASNSSEIENIQSITVSYPSEILKDGVRLIDTPGTNDTDEQRVEVTYKLLPQVDAVIYATIYPITNSNLKVLEEKILANSIPNVFYVLNQVDLLTEPESAVEDAKKWIESCVKMPINLYCISAFDYIEGMESGNEALITSSGFLRLKNDLEAFLVGGDKFKTLAAKYEYELCNLKSQAIEILGVKKTSLILPENIFQERKRVLVDNLKQYKSDADHLVADVNADILRLTGRIEDSLDKLLLEMIENLELQFSAPSSDNDYLLKSIELGLKARFQNWRQRNEPIMREFLQSIHDEVDLRMGKVIHEINLSLTEYKGGLDSRRELEVRSATDPVRGLLRDERHASLVVSAAGVGTYALLAVAHVAFAPLAILIAPLGAYLIYNKNREERKQLKERVIQEIVGRSRAFKDGVLSSVYESRDAIQVQIESIVSEFTKSITKSLEDVQDSRTKMEKDVSLSVERINSAISHINGL